MLIQSASKPYMVLNSYQLAINMQNGNRYSTIESTFFYFICIWKHVFLVCQIDNGFSILCTNNFEIVTILHSLCSIVRTKWNCGQEDHLLVAKKKKREKWWMKWYVKQQFKVKYVLKCSKHQRMQSCNAVIWYEMKNLI